MDEPEILLILALSSAIFILISLILHTCWKKFGPRIPILEGLGKEESRPAGRRSRDERGRDMLGNARDERGNPGSSFNAAAVVARR